jgi:hypothetical protein
MSTAAYALPVENRGAWLDELDRILDCWGDLSYIAQDSVTAVVESFLADPDTSPTDNAAAQRLLTRMRPRADSAWSVVHGRQGIRVSGSTAALA